MQVSRVTVLVVLIVGCAAAFLTSACASKPKAADAKPQAAVVASDTVSKAPAPAPAPSPSAAPSSRPTKSAASTRPTTRATTRPSTRPTAGPTEQSAGGVVALPAPALSPEEALKTFTLAPGFRIELVASEPLIQDPVVT